ncbi:BMP family ABC transporter substrate-binding protein [Desulfobacter sp.]
MVLDTGGDKDHGYNECSLRGAQKAAETSGLDFEYMVNATRKDYDKNIKALIDADADLIFTIGSTQADATAKAAGRYPDHHFVIMDYAFSPGISCSDTVSDCYTQESGLANVTSIVFKEDQPAYLGGTLAACMSESQNLGIVAGDQIPPVLRLVSGFENGAKSINPQINIQTIYIPDFDDEETGYQVARKLISNGADILFCPAGKTGLGGLKAAAEFNVKALGVDVDQYITVPSARHVLITSVMKNVDVAAGAIVEKFAKGTLRCGVYEFDLKSHGVGLAPYHEWEGKIPQKCTQLVALASKKIVLNPNRSLSK